MFPVKEACLEGLVCTRDPGTMCRYISGDLQIVNCLFQYPQSVSDPSVPAHSTSTMASEQATIVPTERELAHFKLGDPRTLDLVTRAQASYEADHKLGVREAVKKYKTAVFWSLLLSLALVMEGYDVVVVSNQLFLIISNLAVAPFLPRGRTRDFLTQLPLL